MIPQDIYQNKFQNDFKYQKKSRKGKSKVAANKNCVSQPKEEEKIEKLELPKVKEEKVQANLKNFEDFPKLRLSVVNENFPGDEKNNAKYFGKSWISVVNSVEKNKNFNESFPKLPNNRNFKKEKDNLNNPSSSLGEKKQETESKELREAKSKNYLLEAPKNVQHKKKSVHSKKPTNQTQKNLNKKKRSDPIILNFSDVINGEVTKSKKRQPNFTAHNVNRTKKKDIKFGNTLDSANPKLHRGKHREIKSKKFSRLKFAIIKERIFKQKVREKAVADYFGKECSDLYTKINFQVEIKKYIEDLNKKKLVCKQEDKIKNVDSFEKEGNAELKRENFKCVEGNDIKSRVKDMRPKTNSTTFKVGNIFSSKLREYCDNIVTPSLNLAVGEFIKAIVNLQDKFFARDPIKAKVRRRHVSGLKEVKQHLILNKVKLLVIAPDLEKLQMEGSIFDLINELKCKAKEQNVPYVFALGRYKLGRCARKSVPVSAFACLNYNGVEDLYENVLKELNESRKKFTELEVSEKKSEPNKESEADVTSEVISSFIEAFRESLQVVKEEKNDED